MARNRRFRGPAASRLGGLALASVSDALIYVGLQRQTDFDPTVFPLLFVVTAVASWRWRSRSAGSPTGSGGSRSCSPATRCSCPSTGCSSRSTGHRRHLVLALLALGAYFAATEGVATALAGAILPERLQATGIGILITVTSIGQFASSLAFGALWFALGLETAVLIFGARTDRGLAIATPLLMRMRLEPAG